MKIKLNTNLVVNLALVGLIIFIFVRPLVHHYTSPITNTFNSWLNNVRPIDPVVSDNLPHWQYIKLTDSITTLRNLKNGDIAESDGVRIGFIGVFKNISCDTCSLKWYHTYRFNDKRFEQNYIKLYNWKLGIDENLRYVDDGKFFVNYGQGFVRRAIIDTVVHREDGSLYNKVTIKDIPVKFRYNHNDNCLMIPISPSTAQLLKTIVYVIAILVAVYILFLILCFLQFLISLSKGYSFTDKNIFILKLISISLFALPVLMFLFNYLLRIIFNTYFTENVIFSNDVWNDSSWKILGTGAVFFLLFNAFRQGRKLKEEQDLTI